MTYKPVTYPLNSFVMFLVKLASGVFGLAAVSIAVLTFWLSGSSERMTREMIPAELEPGRLIAGDFSEITGSAIYEIDREAAVRLIAENSNEWVATPASPSGKTNENCLFVGCAGGQVGAEIENWLARPGSFYRIRKLGRSDSTLYVLNTPSSRLAVIWAKF